jgi:hypothetical protein
MPSPSCPTIWLNYDPKLPDPTRRGYNIQQMTANGQRQFFTMAHHADDACEILLHSLLTVFALAHFAHHSCDLHGSNAS